MFSADDLDPFLPEEPIVDFPPTVMQKVEKMKQKTKTVIDLFNIPDTENVIQDYRCSMKSDEDGSGKLFITQNYLLFAGNNNKVLESIPLYRISSLSKEKGFLFLSSGIKVDLDSKTVHFSGFVHRDEAFNLIRHLWTFQPTYVELSESDILGQIKNEYDIQLPKPNIDLKKFDGRWGELEQNIKDEEEREIADINTGTMSIRKIMEIRDIQTSTLERLQSQAESLDRTEYQLKETRNSLAHGSRTLDGIESGAGQLKNMLTPNLHKGKGPHEQIDRTVEIDAENCTDIPILIKQPNDFLEPGILRFGEKRFRCLNVDRQEIKKYSYLYSQVLSIVIRARHQHLDIKFRETSDRFRCCSSFLQAIVNELFLRTKAGQIRLIHEPETRRFQYGNFAIRELTLKGARDADNDNSDANFITNANYAAILSDAPEEIVAAQMKQDEHINEISSLMSDIKTINNAVGKEMYRQVDQLDNIHKSSDSALKEANKVTYRTTRLA